MSIGIFVYIKLKKADNELKQILQEYFDDLINSLNDNRKIPLETIDYIQEKVKFCV